MPRIRCADWFVYWLCTGYVNARGRRRDFVVISLGQGVVDDLALGALGWLRLLRRRRLWRAAWHTMAAVRWHENSEMRCGGASGEVG